MKSTLYEQWEKIHGPSSKPYIAMIDVESLGLHGPAVAFGISVWQKDGSFKTERYYTVSRQEFERMILEVKDSDASWFIENVLPQIEDELEISNSSHEQFLRACADAIGAWHSDADLWGDCIFPVETNFVSKLIADGHLKLDEAPYPLYDLSTLLSVNVSRANFAGFDNSRAHQPGIDAHHSAAALFRETDFTIA